VLPAAGDSVFIPFVWNLILDISPPPLNVLNIAGDLTFDPTKDLTLQAKIIWVSQGHIYIGSQNNPYTKNAKIILNG
jgi:hypothetical protein